MTGPSPANSQFDAFLFASLFEQEDQPVSVLSALTRQDIDPWQEAARLSRLPQDHAVNSLAATIWKLTSERWSPSEASIQAVRLIELLPSERKSGINPAVERVSFQGLVMMWVIYAIVWGAIASGNNTPQSTTSYGEPSHIVSTAIPQ